jgi:ABC-type multidrug transport system fused ATPase/permease subunit
MVFIVVLIIAFVLQLFLPWWVIIVISFATCGLIGKTAKISFWQPFFAIAVLWVSMAMYKSLPNHHILANRVAVMFGLKIWPLILFVTALIGGLTAGICGFCGYQFRKATIKSKAKA